MLDRITCVAFLWSQVAVLATASACFGPPELTVGSKAPEISLGEYVQASDGAPTRLHELRGKVVVLDFSTTWCVGCMLAVPHINTLVTEFKNDPVVFLTISNETGPNIRRFLKNHKLDTWIALDDANQTTEAFANTGYPPAIVIDKNGRVAALCHPFSITPAAIRKVLAGQPAGVDTNYNSGVRGNVDRAQGAATDPDSADAVSQVILRRSMARGGIFQFKPESGRSSGEQRC